MESGIQDRGNGNLGGRLGIPIDRQETAIYSFSPNVRARTGHVKEESGKRWRFSTKMIA